MNFSYCESLTEIPDLSNVRNLERMDFEGCTSLTRIDRSLGSLEKLETLSFRFCSNLESIPSCFKPISLQRLYLTGCAKLEELPNTMKYMACLEELFLDGTAIKELPSSIEFLLKLRQLDLSGCKNLCSLSSSIYNLNLRQLHLDNCPHLSKFPEDPVDQYRRLFWNNDTFGIRYCNLSDLEFLKTLDFFGLSHLDLSGNNFASIPSCISWFYCLREIYLRQCPRLREIPKLPNSTEKVVASDCGSLERFSGWTHMSQLKHLEFDNCHKLSVDYCSEPSKFPEDPVSRTSPVSGDPWLYRDSIFKMRYCNLSNLEFLNGIEFSWLTHLDISGNNFASIPSCISRFHHLREIYLRQCPRLQEIPELPISTEKVVASDCRSLERFFGWTNMNQLTHLEIDSCHKLSVEDCSERSNFPWFEWVGIFKMRYCNLSNLEFLNWIEFSWLIHLDISGNRFASLPSCISKYTCLNEICLCECPLLREIPELPRTVLKVEANDCESLERFSLCHKSRYSFFNCHKWAGNQDSFENLASYLDNRSSLEAGTRSPLKLFHVVLPGGEILPWFHHKSEGDFLSFQLPSSVDFGKIKAVLFCIIIASGTSATRLDVTYDVSINGNNHLSPMKFNLAQAFRFESDHMWFGNVYNFLHELNDFDLYGASVKIQCAVANGTVKKCGAHVIFKEYGHSEATDAVIREVFNFDQNLSELELMDYLYFKKNDDPSEHNDDVGSESNELVFSDYDHLEWNGGPGSRKIDELPNVPVIQDLLDIEELEDTHNEDSELHGQPQRKRLRLMDEHAMTFSDNENQFQLSLALSLQTTVLRTQDSEANDDVGSKSNELVSSDNDHSEWNDEPGSREIEFRMPLALSLRSSVLLSQDLLGIQELEDRRHDSLEAMKDTQGKSLRRIDELPNVPVTQDLLDIEESEDMHNKDLELHGQPRRKRMRLTDERDDIQQ